MMDGRVFQWGEICAGDDRDYRAIEPHFVTGNGFENKRIIQVACGNSHTLALTSEGQVYSWGNNSDGQLGTGIVEGHEVKPAKISGKNEFDSRISYIACGEWTSFALDEGGNVSGTLLNCYIYSYRRLCQICLAITGLVVGQLAV